MRKSLSSRARVLALALCSALTLAGAGLLLPAAAGAYATPGPAPVPGSPGLPDGRVYEEVSPANKPGTQAAQGQVGHPGGEIWASADGNSAAFESSGPMGNAPSGVELYTVAKRSAEGWESYGATPRPLGIFRDIFVSEPNTIDFSADFTKAIFQANAPFVPGQPEKGSIGEAEGFTWYAYGIGTGPTVWLGEPLLANPVNRFPGYQYERSEGLITGASSDLSTVYFDLYGGFYEWHEGRVSPAGVLPDGSLDPYGARPAGYDQFASGARLEQSSENTQNEVSEDGSRAFFVSPNPETGYPAGDVPQLYARETAADGTQSTVLVSRDTLLPAVDGLPAAAPDGPLHFTSANPPRNGGARTATCGRRRMARARSS